LENPERQIELHFLPPYAPHLNPIKRSWGIIGKCVIHNRHYATFIQFTEEIYGAFAKPYPTSGARITITVTDHFRIISLDEYKII
jgi:hypothetical protein